MSYVSSPSCLKAPFFKSNLPNKNSLTQGNTTYPAALLNGFSIGPPHEVMSAIFWRTGEKRVWKAKFVFAASHMFLLSKKTQQMSLVFPKRSQNVHRCAKIQKPAIKTKYKLKNVTSNYLKIELSVHSYCTPTTVPFISCISSPKEFKETLFEKSLEVQKNNNNINSIDHLQTEFKDTESKAFQVPTPFV